MPVGCREPRDKGIEVFCLKASSMVQGLAKLWAQKKAEEELIGAYRRLPNHWNALPDLILRD